jgi:hypothetical protein
MTTLQEIGMESLENVLKVAVPAGLLAGAFTGVVARVAMRAFAVATGEQPAFSLGGTLAVVFIFAVILGIPLAVIYVRFLGSIPGVAYGLLLLLVLVAIPFLLIPSDDATMRLRLTAIAAFLPVPLIYGYALAQVAERLVRSL